jgi:hypothetical protein
MLTLTTRRMSPDLVDILSDHAPAGQRRTAEELTEATGGRCQVVAVNPSLAYPEDDGHTFHVIPGLPEDTPVLDDRDDDNLQRQLADVLYEMSDYYAELGKMILPRRRGNH